jgi:hypothetical protein
MTGDGTATGFAGARSWPGARGQHVPADAPVARPGDEPAARLTRRPSGARFRSEGRHAEGRDGARRSPSGWPFGSRAKAPDLLPPPVTAAVRAEVHGYGARWIGAGRLCP